MPGVLWNVDEELEGVESSGLCRGVLQEDMIDTVRRVKRPFIDVFMEDMFFEDADYPLTYVPMVNMVLPLRKGQEVWVCFNQQNHRYPVLWKLADRMGDDTDFVAEKFSFAIKGSVVSMPEAGVTKTVFKVSDSAWVISTESYCVMRYGDSCVLMNAGGVFTNADTVNVVANSFSMDVLEEMKAQIKELELAVNSLSVKAEGKVSITSSECTINNVLKVM